MAIFDVIVIGLGAMGSAAAHMTAKRGKRVLGLEYFTGPHDKGSSHGSSRIIRVSCDASPPSIVRTEPGARMLASPMNCATKRVDGRS